MSITMMTDKAAYEAHLAGTNPNKVVMVTNYPGHQTDHVAHSYDCPIERAIRDAYPSAILPPDVYEVATKQITHDCSAKCRFYDPLYMETTHVGLVIETREMNGPDDSDFYALVWNTESGCVERVNYATTRFWTYPNGAFADATPEVLAAYNAKCEADRLNHMARLEAERAAEKARKIAETAALQAKFDAVPAKDAKVEVVNNRSKKAKKGETGKVFWKGVNKFDETKIAVGITMDDGRKVFMNADAVRAV